MVVGDYVCDLFLRGHDSFLPFVYAGRGQRGVGQFGGFPWLLSVERGAKDSKTAVKPGFPNQSRERRTYPLQKK